MDRFSLKGSNSYNERISKLIPGYRLLHQLTASFLKTALSPHSRVLSIGAGTGNDILELAKIEPSWNYTALDISQDMLDIAKVRLAEAELTERVSFHWGDVMSLNESGYDGAICMFVLHFIKSMEEKIEILSSINKKLKPGGFFLTADLTPCRNEHERLAQGEASRCFGLEREASEQMLKRMERDFYPLNKEDLESAARSTGFEKPLRYFQALRFSGFVLRKKE